MKPQRQLVRHDPENGAWGDCYRTAVACVLDMDAADVPHFLHGCPDKSEEERRVREFLEPLGLCMVDIAFQLPPEEVLAHMGALNPRAVWLLSAISKRGCGHVVVCRGGEIVCDPASSEGHTIVSAYEDGMTWVALIARGA